MNALNRLIIVLGVLAFIALVVTVIVLAWAKPDASIERMGDLVEYVDAHNNDTAKLAITLGGIILVLLAIAAVLVELAPPQTPRVEVRDVETGTALISTDAVARRLEQIVAALPEVVMARAKVLPRRRGVDVTLNLHVEPDSDVAAVADRASRLVQDALSQKMKVELSRPPRLHLSYQEPQRRARGGLPEAPVAAKEAEEMPPRESTAEAKEKAGASTEPAANERPAEEQ